MASHMNATPTIPNPTTTTFFLGTSSSESALCTPSSSGLRQLTGIWPTCMSEAGSAEDMILKSTPQTDFAQSRIDQCKTKIERSVKFRAGAGIFRTSRRRKRTRQQNRHDIPPSTTGTAVLLVKNIPNLCDQPIRSYRAPLLPRSFLHRYNLRGEQTAESKSNDSCRFLRHA